MKVGDVRLRYSKEECVKCEDTSRKFKWKMLYMMQTHKYMYQANKVYKFYFYACKDCMTKEELKDYASVYNSFDDL